MSGRSAHCRQELAGGTTDTQRVLRALPHLLEDDPASETVPL
jgi:hypothetical protein